MKNLIYIILICPLLALGQTLNEDKSALDTEWDLTESEWKNRLTELEYYVLR